MKDFEIENEDKELTSNFIYYNLVCFNISPSQCPNKSTKEFFRKWQERYSSRDMQILELPVTKKFLNFSSGVTRGNEIKLYILIRVNTLEDAKTIIDFVDGNDYIKEGLIKVNPFIPNFKGIGITMDNCYAYNFVVAELIGEYIKKEKLENKLDEVSIENFNLFVKNKIENLMIFLISHTIK